MKRILIIIAIILFVAGIITYYSYETWLENRIKYQFSEIINKDPSSLYRYTFTDLDINVVSGSVDVRGVSARPTELAYERLNDRKDKLRFLIYFTLDEIKLEGLDIQLFLTTGKISIKSLNIENPGFEYYFNTGKKVKQENMPLQEIFNKNFQEAVIGSLLIRNGEITIDNHDNHEDAIRVHNFNMKLENARMDSITLTQFTPFEYEDIKIFAGGFKVDASEDFELNSGELTFKVGRQSLEIRDFQLNPKYNKESFSAKYDYQKQWMAIKLERLELENIDTERFVNTGFLDISKIILRNPALSLYKNKTKEEGDFEKKHLPASMLHQVNWSVKADTVIIDNGFVSFDMTSNITRENSRMIFTEIHGSVVNLTNDTASLIEHPTMTIHGNGKVFNKIQSELIMDFDLMNPEDQYHVHGEVGTFEAMELTPVLEPLAGIRLDAGTFDKIDFDFYANDHQSSGHLNAMYSNLNVILLKEDTAGKKKRGFISAVANTFMNTNNDPTKGSFRPGIIQAERDQNKGIFNQIWLSVQSGLVSTIAPVTIDKEIKEEQRRLRKKRNREGK
jgi:hypothetical protein